jgi:hypothetical protein
MAPKAKSTDTSENPILPPPVDLDHIPLVDKDYKITEPRCEFDFFELHSWLKDIFLDQSDEIGLWESNLPLYMFPQTHHFPEFSLRCQARYFPGQRAIASSSGEILFTVTSEAIDQMLQIPRNDSAIPFSIEALNDLYQKLTFPQRAQIFEIFLPEDAQFPKKNPPYSSSIFTVKANQIIPMLSYLLGYYSDEWVDEPILGFLSIFSTEERVSIKFNFSQFLADNIHDQLFRFPTEGMFRYSSVLVYMFLFYQSDRFPCALQKLNQEGSPQPVTSWTSLVRKNSTEYSFKDFIDQFIHPVVCMLNNNTEPRINEEIQRVLHLSDQAKTGDWYLYQNHTEIRVYGCEFPPYRLPKYLPVRIFALEYIRKMVNSDDIHFVAAKKKSQLRIKTQIGPFICNNRSTGEEEDNLLKQMRFPLSSTWAYDPFGVISELRIKQRSTPYVHTQRPEVEKYMNQTEWQENTLQEPEEQPAPVTTSHTNTPQNKVEKRSRKEVSPSVTEVSTEDFQVYRKRAKTSHTTYFLKEGEMQSTIVLEGPHSSTHSDSQFTVSTSSPTSQRNPDTTLTTESTHGKTESNIFDKYKQIKQRNELLNNNTYAQFWKQTSTAQHRLLSSFDTERGRMQMEFLQAQVPHPKTVADYKKTSFEFDVKDVHPVDQMDMHRQTGEMIFSTLKNTSMTASKLQVSLNNIQSQLKLEKISSLAKDNKIKSLEELVLKIGYDPTNVKAAEELLKKKNVDIASLEKEVEASSYRRFTSQRSG